MGSQTAVGRDIVIICILVLGLPALVFGGGWVALTWLDTALSGPSDEVLTVQSPAVPEIDASSEPPPVAEGDDVETHADLPVHAPATAGADTADATGGLGVATDLGALTPTAAPDSAGADTAQPATDSGEESATGGLVGIQLADDVEDPAPTDGAEELGSGAVAGTESAIPTDPPVERLRKRHINPVVKQYVGTLAPCLVEIQNSNLLRPGKYRILLDFSILPDGSVITIRLRKPKKLRNTIAGACVVNAVGRWRFPSSNRGGPAKNVSLPFTIE